MNKLSTPSNDCNKTDLETQRMNKHLFSPSRKSIAFIMQFAKAYHVEKKLSINHLSEMVLN